MTCGALVVPPPLSPQLARYSKDAKTLISTYDDQADMVALDEGTLPYGYLTGMCAVLRGRTRRLGSLGVCSGLAHKITTSEHRGAPSNDVAEWREETRTAPNANAGTEQQQRHAH